MLKHFIEGNKYNPIFVRNSYRRYVYIALFLLFVNCCLVAFLYLTLLNAGKPEYFATTSDGRIVNIYPEQ